MRFLELNAAIRIGVYIIGLASIGYTCSFVVMPPTEVDPLLAVFGGTVIEHHECHDESQDLVFLTVAVTEVISNAEICSEYQVLPLMVAPDCSNRRFSYEMLATRYPIGSTVWVIGRPLDVSPSSSSCWDRNLVFLEASPQDGCFVRRIADSLPVRRSDVLDVRSWELELDAARSALLVGAEQSESKWRFEAIDDFKYFDARREMVNLASAQTPQEVDGVIGRLEVHPLYRDLPGILNAIRNGATN